MPNDKTPRPAPLAEARPATACGRPPRASRGLGRHAAAPCAEGRAPAAAACSGTSGTGLAVLAHGRGYWWRRATFGREGTSRNRMRRFPPFSPRGEKGSARRAGGRAGRGGRCPARSARVRPAARAPGDDPRPAVRVAGAATLDGAPLFGPLDVAARRRSVDLPARRLGRRQVHRSPPDRRPAHRRRLRRHRHRLRRRARSTAGSPTWPRPTCCFPGSTSSATSPLGARLRGAAARPRPRPRPASRASASDRAPTAARAPSRAASASAPPSPAR